MAKHGAQQSGLPPKAEAWRETGALVGRTPPGMRAQGRPQTLTTLDSCQRLLFQAQCMGLWAPHRRHHWGLCPEDPLLPFPASLSCHSMLSPRSAPLAFPSALLGEEGDPGAAARSALLPVPSLLLRPSVRICSSRPQSGAGLPGRGPHVPPSHERQVSANSNAVPIGELSWRNLVSVIASEARVPRGAAHAEFSETRGEN